MENHEANREAAIELIMRRGGNVISYIDAERLVYRIDKGCFESVKSLEELIKLGDKIHPVYVEKSKSGVVWLASHVAFLMSKNQAQAAQAAERYLDSYGYLINVPYPLIRAACNIGVDMPYIYSSQHPTHQLVVTIDMR